MLSVDPSSTELGWAVFNRSLVDYGIIKAYKKKRWERFQLIVNALNSIVERYDVDEVACERVFISPKIRAEALSVAMQCIKQWAKDRKLALFLYSPGEWKHSVIGYGQATKEQVARIIYLQYPELPGDIPFHVTDAIAIGQHREGIKLYERLSQREVMRDDERICG